MDSVSQIISDSEQNHNIPDQGLKANPYLQILSQENQNPNISLSQASTISNFLFSDKSEETSYSQDGDSQKLLAKKSKNAHFRQSSLRNASKLAKVVLPLYLECFEQSSRNLKNDYLCFQEENKDPSSIDQNNIVNAIRTKSILSKIHIFNYMILIQIFETSQSNDHFFHFTISYFYMLCIILRLNILQNFCKTSQSQIKTPSLINPN